MVYSKAESNLNVLPFGKMSGNEATQKIARAARADWQSRCRDAQRLSVRAEYCLYYPRRRINECATSSNYSRATSSGDGAACGEQARGVSGLGIGQQLELELIRRN